VAVVVDGRPTQGLLHIKRASPPKVDKSKGWALLWPATAGGPAHVMLESQNGPARLSPAASMGPANISPRYAGRLDLSKACYWWWAGPPRSAGTNGSARLKAH
jgi:hypothetical protein